MGILQGPGSARFTLGKRCLVGRSSSADLRIRDDRVSNEHALLKWAPGHWVLRELGSLNGTYLDGERLAPGTEVTLHRGVRLGFAGNTTPWLLLDDKAPFARARRIHDDLCIEAQGSLLSLPGDGEGGVSIFVGASGEWLLDAGSEGIRPVQDHEVIEVARIPWQLELPAPTDAESSTTRAGADSAPSALSFRVDRLEEHVEIHAISTDGVRKLPDRAHNHMLLVLAREQIEDPRDRSDAERGWIHVEDLARKLGLDVGTLTVQIWRARKSFASAGLSHTNVVERRKYSGLIRLGFRVQEITSL